MIKYNITFSLRDIADKIEVNKISACRKIGERVLSSCEMFVPYNTGELYSSGSVSAEGNVIWSAPHASACYYSRRPFNQKHHPRACARWFEAAKSIHLDSWKNVACDAMTDFGTLPHLK